jgi:hypothetical protein
MYKIVSYIYMICIFFSSCVLEMGKNNDAKGGGSGSLMPVIVTKKKQLLSAHHYAFVV